MPLRRSAIPFAFLAVLTSLTAAFADPADLWTFDEPGFPSGGVSGGTLVGEAVSGHPTQPQIGSGAYFGNNGSYVFAFDRKPDTTRGWSISTWVRSDVDTGPTDAICAWYPEGGFGGHVLRNNSGRVFFESGTTGYQWSPTTVFNRQWHHLVLTSRSGGAPFTLYIDGLAIQAPTNSTVSASTDFEQSLRIGSNLRRGVSTTSDWDGWIDDFGVINRTLSASEVMLIYGLGKFGIGLAEFGPARPLITAPVGTIVPVAGNRWMSVASGLAGGAGSTSGSLAGSDAQIVISSGGRGYRMVPAPSPTREFTSSPPNFAVSVGSGQSAGELLQLQNPSSAEPLGWEIVAAPGHLPSLEAIHQRIDPSLFKVLAVAAGRTAEAPMISDEGNLTSSAYQNSGNEHHFTPSFSPAEFSIPFRRQAGVHRDSLTSNGQVATVEHLSRSGPGYFILSADLKKVSELRLAGNLSAFELLQHGSSADLIVNGVSWKVWTYQISGTGGPIIQHVLLTPPDATIEGQITDDFSESYRLSGLPDSCRIHHFWFIRDFDGFDQTTLLEVARTFLRATHAPASWIRPNPPSGEVAAAATAAAALEFNSDGLAPGIHEARFAVIPAGTDVAEAPASRFHDARIDVIPPQFTATGPAAGVTLLSGIQYREEKIILRPAAGFSFGVIDASSDASWLRALPSENRIGEIDLRFDTSGMAEGVHRATVTVKAGKTVQLVEIEVEVRKPEIRQILADPFRDRMYLLHDGSDHVVNSRILVVKASDGTFIRGIDVGRVYRIAQSPDGKRLFGLRQPDHAIVPVDLQRMLVEAPIPLPAGVAADTPFSDLEAGGSGVLYFLNRAYASKLHVFDTRTATVLQKFDNPQDATAFFSRLKLSPDRKELWATQTVSDTFSGPFQILTRYRIEADGRLTAQPALSRRMLDLPSLSKDHEIVTGHDADPVAISSMTFDPAHPEKTTRFQRERIRAMAPEGEFFVGKEAIYSHDGLRQLRQMPTPLNLDAVAVSPEGHLFHAALGSYGFIDLIGTLGASAAGFHETPGDGEITAIPGEFRWLPVDGVREYRLHLARTADALATATPAAGTITRSTRHYRIDSPVPLAGDETWFWRVDSLTGTGWITGRVRSFSTDSGLPESTRLQSDVVQGCIAQPVDLGLPHGSPWQPTASDRPWLTLPAAPGQPARIDSRLANVPQDRATITLSNGDRSATLTVDLRVLPGTYLDLIADGLNGRVFALVSGPEPSPDRSDQSGPDFVVRLDPVTGKLLECFPAGRRARSMFLSPDGSRLAVEQWADGNSLDFRAGGLEIYNAADGRRTLTLGSFSTYPAGRKSGTAFGPGGRLMVPRTLIDESSGQILAKGDRFTPDFSHFSPDGGSLFGEDINGVYRHDANSPTLGRTHVFSKRENGYERLRMSADGTRLAKGTSLLDQDLQLVTTTPQLIMNMDRKAELAVSPVGLHHLPSFRRILPLASPLQFPVFCESAGTLLHVTRIGGETSAPEFAVIDYRDLLDLDASSIAPSPAEASLMLESSAALSWSDLPAAARFRVFFGTDRSAVEAAAAGSPLELGVTTATSWSPPVPVARGTVYFWKIIAEGPGGSSSSPLWSFATSSFELGASSFTAVSTINGPIARDEIELTAPSGTGWSLSTATPWIRLPEPAGSGSGSLRIEADPAGLTGREQAGSVTLTIEGRSLVLPVKFTTLFYRIRAIVADNDEAVMHALVIPSGFDITNSDLYLIRFDMKTQRAIQVGALGHFINPNASNSFSMFVHQADKRVHVFDAQSSTLLSARADDYREIRSLDFSSFLPPGTSTNHFTPTIANRLIVTGPDRRSARLYDSNTGARVADVPTGPSGSWSFFRKGSSEGARIYATVGNLVSGSPLRSYDVFPDRVEAGPVATAFSGASGASGVSGDGSTVHHLRGLYDRDLILTGTLGANLALVNRDASRLFMQPSTNRYQWTSSDGTILTPAIFISANSFVSDPSGDVAVAVGPSSSSWVVIPDPAILPAIPGAKWITTGAGSWSAPESGMLRTPVLAAPGTTDIATFASLHASFPTAGTLGFQWRNFGNTNDRFILRINGSDNEFVQQAAGWQTKSVSLPAGAFVEWTYSSQTAAATATAELRDITFTPAAAALIAPIEPASDRDGDGASDLLETALGSDPDDATDRPSTGLVRIDSGWAFQFDRPAGLPFVYQVESSADLQSWDDHPDDPAVSPLGNLERVRVSVPVPAGQDRRFFRLRVTPTAP
jgi:hypothetical protein